MSRPMTCLSVLLFFLASSIFVVPTTIITETTAYNLPSAEYQALYDLFNATHGSYWQWVQPYSVYGYPWTFQNPSNNPCSESYPWQGVGCTSSCMTSPCYVYNLTLSAHNLTGSIPSTLSNLTQLALIDLSINHLHGSISQAVFSNRASTLLSLDLSRNLFTGELPLKDLTSLVYLNLSTTMFFDSEIPDTIGDLIHLQQLDLSNIDLWFSDIPESIGNLHDLIVLDLSNNYMFSTVPHSIEQLVSLQSLDLSDNNFYNSPSTLPVNLSNLTNLIYLDLSNNMFSLFPTFITQSNTGTTQLVYLDLSSNGITESIPIQQFQYLSKLKLLDCFENNGLTGTIPRELFDYLGNLSFIDLSHNILTGTIPLTSLVNLTSLQYFGVGSNQLTGSLVIDTKDVGEGVSVLFPAMKGFDVSRNRLHGPLVSTTTASSSSTLTIPYFSNALKVLYLHENQFTGSIPHNYVEGCVNLLIVTLSSNCLTGTLPSTMFCSSTFYNMKEIVFDGLHSSKSCINRAISFIPNSGYVIPNAVHGTIPICLLYLPHLTLLQLASNSFSGSIPIGVGNGKTLSSTLESLDLSNNQLTGIVPQSVWFSNVTNLDLSFNRLQGTLPEGMLPQIPLHANGYNPPNNGIEIENSVILKVNQFSGKVPVILQTANIYVYMDILQSNLFQCNVQRNDLPKHDENVKQYDCASDSTNEVLIAIAIWLLISVMIVMRDKVKDRLWRWKEIYRVRLWLGEKVLMGGTTVGARVDGWRGIGSKSGGSNPIGVEVGMEMSVRDGGGDRQVSSESMSMVSNESVIGHVERLLTNIDTLTLRLTCYILVICMLVYSILQIYASTYTYSYVWSISSIYLSGINACIVLFLLYTGCIVIVTMSLPTYQCWDLLYAWTIREYTIWCMRRRETDETESVNDNNKTQPLATQSSSNTPTTSTAVSLSSQWIVLLGCTSNILQCQYHSLYLILLLLCNIIVVLTINILFVLAYSNNDISYRLLAFISFLVSLFKLIWNYLIFLGEWDLPLIPLYQLLGRTIRMVYRYIIQIKAGMRRNSTDNDVLVDDSDTNDNDSILHKILTDNIVIGLCLFNTILAPLIAESWVSPACFLYIVQPSPEPLPYTDLVHPESGFWFFFTPTITPPFHYSYQCSFILIASYVHVFLFRYLISSIIQPLFVWGLNLLACSSFAEWCGITRILTICVHRITPSLWRLHVSEGGTYDREEDMIALESSIQSIEKDIVMKVGRQKRKAVVKFVSAISVMLAYAMIFPPLVLVIALSILSDTWEIRLSLGRMKQVMMQLEDEERVKKVRMKEDGIDEQEKGEKSVRKNSKGEESEKVSRSALIVRLDNVIKHMNDELHNANDIVWVGIWYSLCVSVWIWAFVLFDVLSAEIGIAKSIPMVIVMISLPYVVRYCFGYVVVKFGLDSRWNSFVEMCSWYIFRGKKPMSTMANEEASIEL